MKRPIKEKLHHFWKLKIIIPKFFLTQDPVSYDDNGVKQINVIDWLLKS